MRTVLAIILCITTQFAFAGVSWNEAILVNQKMLGSAGGENVFECTYQLLTGGTYRFSTRYKGYVCPYSILVNIETGKWK
jgi:hypothetical protein